MTVYSVIQPPFTLEFDKMSKHDLRNYHQWFLEVMPDRILGISDAIRQTPGFKEWRPDNTPSSLQPLGVWFAGQVETRPRTSEELERLSSQNSYPVEVSNQELTNRTFSLAIDIGMYLARVFQQNHPLLRWEHWLKGKKDIDYGQPVLIGFGRVPFNPTRMVITLAYGLAHKTKNGTGLREIYDIWAKKAPG